MTTEHSTSMQEMPQEPIRKIVAPISRFMQVESASGIVLLAATAAALLLANSPLAPAFLGFWETPIVFSAGALHFEHSLQHWINDGLMALFFFVVGLEVKRELVLGQLRDVRQAALPIAGALGGMLLPAAVYLLLQHEGPGRAGWGIPMATDIAFVVGCMVVLGSRVPSGLRVMMLTLAITDDLGAILVIAIGYSSGIHGTALAIGFALVALVLLCARLGVRSILVYWVLGFAVWFAFYKSGIHATIAGVILGLITPARSYLSTSFLAGASRGVLTGDWKSHSHHDRAARVLRLQHAAREIISPLEYLEAVLHPWVAFLIMPVFALANAGVPITWSELGNPVSVAVTAGLLIGKPVGIVVFCWLAVKSGLGRLPDGVTWPILLGAGILGGIGFTMALFIAGLALTGPELDAAKIGVLAGSILSATLGMVLLGAVARPPKQTVSAAS
jgi:NhaA family Na+:H+ antiporter